MVLVVATSIKTRGGITSVVKAYKNSDLWNQWNCKWIQTHIDKSFFHKILYFTIALIQFVYLIPFARIIHIHLSGSVSVRRKLVFIRLTKLFRKKLIIHLHAFGSESSLEKKYEDLYVKTFNLADIVIVLSNNWKNSLIRDFDLNQDSIKVVYNPCPDISRDDNVNKEPIILYAGTLNKRKNYKNLIKAFAKIAKKYPKWKLALAGNGEIDKAKALSSSLNIDNQIECMGWIDGEKKHDIFSKATIFCLPSYAEGFPMAVLDAWSYGLPVITTPVGGIPDIANDGENILLFNPDDIDQLALNIERVIVDERLRLQLSSEAIKFSKNMFHISSITKKIDDFYKLLIASKH